MDINDTAEVLAAIKQAAKGVSAYEVREFEVERAREVDGETIYQQVTVKILDRGPEGSPRYSIYGTSDDGKRFAGNSEDDLHTAIIAAHWFDLDK